MYDDAGLEAFVTKRINEFFSLAGMSAYKFSLITGISRTTISDYLNGKRRPSIYFLGVCCNYWGVTQEEFYEPYDSEVFNHKTVDVVTTSADNEKIIKVHTMRILENISKKIDVLMINANVLN